MNNTKTINGLMHRLQNAFTRFVGSGANARSRSGRRLAPLQELEDRCLLSVTPVGSPYLVNTYTQGAQQTSPQTPHAVAMNPTNGNYVVAWSSQAQNGGGYDVYFQLYNAAGVAQGPATLVDTPVNGANQQYANVAMNSSGNFVVTWSSNAGGHWNVYAQQYNASGVAQGAAILVDTPTNADQEYSTVALNDSGNFVVAWSNQTSGTWQIFANAFNQSGVSTSYGYVTNASADQMYPDVALNDAGTTVITWSGHQSSHWNVYAEMFTSQPQGIFQVNTNMTNDQEYSSIAMDANGNFTIAWSGQQNGNWNIYAQSYLSSGAANGSNFQVSPANGNDQEYASIAFAVDGNPIITWSNDGTGPTGWGIYAQQVTPTGTPLGTEIHVNSYTMGDQYYSSVAGAANGDVVIVWSSNNEVNSLDVFGQNYVVTVSPGFTVTPTSIQTSMSGASASFSVALTSAPVASVTINLTDGNPTDGTLSTNTLTFDASNWNVAQSVTVTGQNDSLAGADVTYQITGSASSGDANYNNVTITPVTVTNVDNYSKTSVISSGNFSAYGQTVTFTATVGVVDPALGTPTGTVTFVDGTTDLAIVSLAGGTAAYTTSALSAGNHDITADYSGDATFVASTSTTLTQSVTPAALTITADNASKTYGQTVVFAGTEFTTAGLVNSDTVTGATLTSTGAAATVAVAGSPYAITASAVTGTGLSNYSISFVNGTLTVTPATLTVTADNASKVHGQTNPVFTDTITGFVNGDTSAVVSGKANLITPATLSSGTGSYTITAAQGTLSAANYSFAFANGTLTIQSAPIIVTPVSSPVSPTLIANALLGLTAPHSATSSASGNSDSGSNSERALAAKILQVSARAPNVGNGNAPLESAAPTMLTQAEVVANRTLQIFSPIPPSVSQPIQDVAMTLPEELPFRLNASRILWLRATSSQAQNTLGDDLLDVLSDDGERIPWTEPGLETTILVGTGLLASSGYVLLNSRLGLWLLGVLTARPLWKQFDPLEVLYAWDDDGRYLARDDEDEEETLMSLVE